MYSVVAMARAAERRASVRGASGVATPAVGLHAVAHPPRAVPLSLWEAACRLPPRS
jgi:hypothetical protein